MALHYGVFGNLPMKISNKPKNKKDTPKVEETDKDNIIGVPHVFLRPSELKKMAEDCIHNYMSLRQKLQQLILRADARATDIRNRWTERKRQRLLGVIYRLRQDRANANQEKLDRAKEAFVNQRKTFAFGLLAVDRPLKCFQNQCGVTPEHEIFGLLAEEEFMTKKIPATDLNRMMRKSIKIKKPLKISHFTKISEDEKARIELDRRSSMYDLTAYKIMMQAMDRPSNRNRGSDIASNCDSLLQTVPMMELQQLKVTCECFPDNMLIVPVKTVSLMSEFLNKYDEAFDHVHTLGNSPDFLLRSLPTDGSAADSYHVDDFIARTGTCLSSNDAVGDLYRALGDRSADKF